MSPFYLLAAAAEETGNWWEPGTPGFLDVGDLSAVLGFVIALVGAVYGVTRWWMKLMRKMMREEIEIATEPIHPNSNGGLSLADVARRTEHLEKEMNSMGRKVDRLSKSVNESNTLLIRFLSETSGSAAFDEMMEEDNAKKASAPKRSRPRKS